MRIIKRKNSHYVQHSFRKDGKIITREKYLGLKVPENIDIVKNKFLAECRKEAFYDVFEIIKTKFNQEWKRLPPSAKEKMIQELSINFTYNTNAIEGSTISEEETRDIVAHGIAPSKPLRDVKETEKHAELFKKIFSEKQKITKQSIIHWHNKLFSETKSDIVGKFRDYLVRVGDYRAPDWQDLNKLLDDFFRFQNSKNNMHTVEFAARVHYKFEKIHPFGDGNGRIGRLIMNSVLWDRGYPLLVIEYKKRKSYYKALRKDEEHFVQYFIRRYLAVHKRYLNKR
ncbi:MAG: Fic family protein [Nanoarchaeota archaeon]|nr:Fic family protein [Nanoarchaeota archaeon]MBU1269534.1 Fic family protein [Nanoarchaeota archaeon]MBU1604418.1 Fic family protein [Nanoarchaeota archaeon]MBU2442432.1 Fic family protein [Nanoarchaeota archaeon]